MDIGASAAASSYLPQQAYTSQQGGGSVRADAPVAANSQPKPDAPPSRTGSRSGTQANAATAGSPGNTDKQAQEARKKNPAAEVTAHPGYAFEVDSQNHKIMKVSDSKGVLIYQIPSKGQLALVSAQENDQKRLQLTA